MTLGYFPIKDHSRNIVITSFLKILIINMWCILRDMHAHGHPYIESLYTNYFKDVILNVPTVFQGILGMNSILDSWITTLNHFFNNIVPLY